MAETLMGSEGTVRGMKENVIHNSIAAVASQLTAFSCRHFIILIGHENLVAVLDAHVNGDVVQREGLEIAETVLVGIDPC